MLAKIAFIVVKITSIVRTTVWIWGFVLKAYFAIFGGVTLGRLGRNGRLAGQMDRTKILPKN